MVKNIKRLPFHYAWVILISCCILTGASMGIIINCKGLFIAPVCSELGCPVSMFNLYLVLYGFASAFMVLKVNSVYEKFSIRPVLTIALSVYCLSTALMGTGHHLITWYVMGILQGFSGAFLLYVLPPFLLKNWFIKRRGFALGLSGTFSGIFGAFMAPVLNEIIQKYGWRTGYFVQGASAFLAAFPFVAFLIVKKPEEMGLIPYGADCTVSAGETKRDSGKTEIPPELIYVLIFIGIVGMGATSTQQFANHAVSIGLGSRIGALMVTCTMIGTISGKVGIGIAADRLGIKKAAFIASAATIAGLFILAAAGSAFWNCSGAVLMGINNANHSVVVPIMVSLVVSQDAFAKAYSKVTMVFMLMVAVCPFLIGTVFDVYGSYHPAFVILGILHLAGWMMVSRRVLTRVAENK